MPTLHPTSKDAPAEVYNSQWVNGTKLNNDKQIFLYSAYEVNNFTHNSLLILECCYS